MSKALAPLKPRSKPVPPADGLTIRQEAFCREYVKHGNGGKAAVAAGYADSNKYSTASTLLALPKVQQEIARHRVLLEERHSITVDRVLRQAARMAFVDPRAYVNDDGSLIPLQELSDDAAAALQGLEVDQTGNGKLRHKYKLVDRGAALDKLMRHLGLFERDNTQAVDAVGQLIASIHTSGSRIPIKG